MIEGLSHLTLIVSDLARTERMIVDVLGGRRIYASGERQFSIAGEIFFDVRGLWLVIIEGAPLGEKTYNHIAFRIDPRHLADAEAAVRNLGLEIRPSRKRVAGEAQSLYFYDYDNHLFELHTGTLDERLRHYNGEAG